MSQLGYRSRVSKTRSSVIPVPRKQWEAITILITTMTSHHHQLLPPTVIIMTSLSPKCSSKISSDAFLILSDPLRSSSRRFGQCEANCCTATKRRPDYLQNKEISVHTMSSCCFHKFCWSTVIRWSWSCGLGWISPLSVKLTQERAWSSRSVPFWARDSIPTSVTWKDSFTRTPSLTLIKDYCIQSRSLNNLSGKTRKIRICAKLEFSSSWNRLKEPECITRSMISFMCVGFASVAAGTLLHHYFKVADHQRA